MSRENPLSQFSFKDAEFLAYLLSLKHIPTINELTKELDSEIAIIFRRLKAIKNAGIKLGVVIDYESLGLYRAVIMTDTPLGRDEIPRYYLRFYTISIAPPGTLLAYFYPNREVFEDIVTKIPNRIHEFEVLKSYYRRPRFDLYFDFREGEYVFNAEVLLSRFQKLRSDVDALKYDLTFIGRRRIKKDSLDLKIIKELEKDALQPLTKVARKIGVSYAKVRKHYKMHVEPLIVGLYVLKLPLPSDVIYVSTLIWTRRVLDALALSKALTETPFVAGAHVLRPINKEYGDYLAVLMLGRFRYEWFDELITVLSSYFVVSSFLLSWRAKSIYTTPYKHEYSKYTASWITPRLKRDEELFTR